MHVIVVFLCTMRDFDALLPQTLAILYEILIISFLEYFLEMSCSDREKF